MAEQLKAWDPKEWERHVKMLLRLRHGAGEFRDVPDEHGGDFGIDGFSLTGFAYQCYAAREPLLPADLYKKQRAKIREDLGKFVENRSSLERLFGDVKIGRWSLVVPRHTSSRLVQYLVERSQEVRKQGLSYITEDFAAIVETNEDFALERKELLAQGLELIRVTSPSVEAVQVEEWADENDRLVQQLDGKIKKLRPMMTEEELLGLRNDFIERFIKGKNVLERLKTEYAEFWQIAQRCKSDREEFLALETAISTQRAGETVNEELSELTKTFKTTVPGIDTFTARTLAFEAISDWMLRCPLDF